jgi:hypothetical protein
MRYCALILQLPTLYFFSIVMLIGAMNVLYDGWSLCVVRVTPRFLKLFKPS